MPDTDDSPYVPPFVMEEFTALPTDFNADRVVFQWGYRLASDPSAARQSAADAAQYLHGGADDV